MRKTIAILLTIIYTCFITGSLWSTSVSAYSVIEQTTDTNKEINEQEPAKDLEAPHLSKVVKNLPVKIKLPRAQTVVFTLRKPSPPHNSASGIRTAGAKNFILDSTPLFIRNSVFRI